jgi:hypothetical protein
MFLVAWTVKDPSRPASESGDHWSAHETIDEAQEAYDKLMADPHLYLASVTAVIASTDYEAMSLRITAHPMDGSITEAKGADEDESGLLDLGALFSPKFEKHNSTRSTNSKEIP